MCACPMHGTEECVPDQSSCHQHLSLVSEPVSAHHLPEQAAVLHRSPPVREPCSGCRA